MSGEAVTVTQALKPCPFCAEVPSGYQYQSHQLCDDWHICCTGAKNCPLFYATPYRVWDTIEEAVAAWNTRQTPAPTAGDELMRQISALVGFCDDGAVTPKVPHTAVELLRSAATRIQSDAATIADLTAKLAEAEAQADALREVLSDLVSWFPHTAPEPEYRVRAGQWGADDAITAARAALATSKGGKGHG